MSQIRERINYTISNKLSKQAQADRIANYARARVKELISQGRASPYYKTFVDGVEGAKEETVRIPDGAIVYDFFNLAKIVDFALGYLIESSANRTGRYQRGFYVGIDEQFNFADNLKREQLQSASEVIIGNVEPYHRKLATGYIGKKQLNLSMPAGYLQRCAAAINSEFKNVRASYNYNIKLPGNYKYTTRKNKVTESPGLVITVKR